MMSNQHSQSFHHEASCPPDVSDPVIEGALSRQWVTNQQVADAWLIRKSMYHMGRRHPVWRWLAEQEGVDREQILGLAAEIYDYKPLMLSVEALQSFVLRIMPCFSEEQWKAMLRLGVIPVKRSSQRGISTLWNFAANDPTSKPVHHLVRQFVGKHYELFQADRKRIASLFGEVYLAKMELPRNTADDSDAR